MTVRIDNLAGEMKFTPLYDKGRKLFSIGFNIEDGRIYNSYYDFLVSEARQTSFIAAARREVPSEHWFRLGRKPITVKGYVGLASWSGTAFEYLMPDLLIKNYETSLLDEAVRTAVLAQIDYIKAKTRPWGISESGFYSFDLNMNYQYKAMGVPGLGFKKGSRNECVIAPYASILALYIAPHEVLRSLKLCEEEGAEGEYGFYEAIDYTQERLMGDKKKIVKSYMAHHQGMSFISIINFLKNNIMKERFHSIPEIRGAEELLQERVPLFGMDNNDIVSKNSLANGISAANILARTKQPAAEIVIPEASRDAADIKKSIPQINVLSNGSYFVLLTNTGAGYSRKDNIYLTKWITDKVSYSGGLGIFINNISNGTSWSAAFYPDNIKPDKYEVEFSRDKAVYTRWNGEIETKIFITVTPEDNAEIRRISIINHGSENIELEISCQVSPILSDIDDYMAHPAFCNLFLNTDFIKEKSCMLINRRRRSPKENEKWMFFTLQDSYRKDSVLDAAENIVLGRRAAVAAGESFDTVILMGYADNREEALKISDKYNDQSNVRRAFDLAYTRSIIEMGYLNITNEQEELYYLMLPHLMFVSPSRREYGCEISMRSGTVQNLWAFGISGDLPIILCFIKDNDEEEFADVVIDAQRFWRIKGISTDLVFITNDGDGYHNFISDMVMEVVTDNGVSSHLNAKGGIFIVKNKKITREEELLLINAAAIILSTDKGSIYDQVRNWSEGRYTDVSDKYYVAEHYKLMNPKLLTSDTGDKEFDNGIGYFTNNGKEYVIYNNTPAPWINIMTNGNFGFQISARGAGFTWSENSREFRITKWSNDSFSDPRNEMIYIKNLETGSYSCLYDDFTGSGNYRVRHGLGYSKFESMYENVYAVITNFVPMEDNVKISITSLKNTSSVSISLRVYYYAEPVLGDLGKETTPHIVTYPVSDGNIREGYMMIENIFTDYPYAFMACSEKIEGFFGDRSSFLGLYGTVEKPAAVMSGTTGSECGAGLQPCTAICSNVTIEAGETKNIIFIMGVCGNKKEDYDTSRNKAETVISKYVSLDYVNNSLARTMKYWEDFVTGIQSETDDKSFDTILNSWLLYQTTACRIMSRSAFYQSGGAFGFRDQLQDSLALLLNNPDWTKAQILRHCRHQFKEGDVQHWWHEPEGKGIRSRYSDDLLWLPYVVSEYLFRTGDYELLHQKEYYLESPVLKEDEHERYDTPEISKELGTVYDHCIRAIEKSLSFGEHSLPLIGGGDWNDGMNLVGINGKGESVWLGWFLANVITRFIPICELEQDNMRAAKYKFEYKKIINSINEYAWDGSWYKRAFMDDGTAIGSATNMECTIDSISQSWAAITTSEMAGDFFSEDNQIVDERLRRIENAIISVDKQLVDRVHGIVKLLSPPFDNGNIEPGYIKGYIPGVRENGGQYTHAAIWYIIGLVRLGLLKGFDRETGGFNHDEVEKWLSHAFDIFHMINPINHSRTEMEAIRYRTEPYAIAADVYSVGDRAGRGGWSFYTGAAGWMYRTAVEEIIGIKRKGNKLLIRPFMPVSWSKCNVCYKAENNTVYYIKFVREEIPETYELDMLGRFEVELTLDGGKHEIVVKV